MGPVFDTNGGSIINVPLVTVFLSMSRWPPLAPTHLCHRWKAPRDCGRCVTVMRTHRPPPPPTPSPSPSPPIKHHRQMFAGQHKMVSVVKRLGSLNTTLFGSNSPNSQAVCWEHAHQRLGLLPRLDLSAIVRPFKFGYLNSSRNRIETRMRIGTKRTRSRTVKSVLAWLEENGVDSMPTHHLAHLTSADRC